MEAAMGLAEVGRPASREPEHPPAVRWDWLPGRCLSPPAPTRHVSHRLPGRMRG